MPICGKALQILQGRKLLPNHRSNSPFQGYYFEGNAFMKKRWHFSRYFGFIKRLLDSLIWPSRTTDYKIEFYPKRVTCLAHLTALKKQRVVHDKFAARVPGFWLSFVATLKGEKSWLTGLVIFRALRNIASAIEFSTKQPRTLFPNWAMVEIFSDMCPT